MEEIEYDEMSVDIKLPYSDKEIDDEMGKFEDKLELERNVIAWEGNDMLNSALSFDQFFLDGSKLVTVIGELHMDTFKCQEEPSMSIAEYAINVTKRNPRALIMLEYQPGCDPSTSRSIPIREISSAIPERTMAFDRRWMFIPGGLDDLYHNNLIKYNNYEKVGRVFIDPLYEKWREGEFKIDPKLYDKQTHNFLYNTYMEDLNQNFRAVADMLRHRKNIHKVVLPKLQHTYKKVGDFYILKEILKRSDKDPINEYVVIVGEAHRENIASILDKFRINNQKGSEGDCVKLFNTYLMK